MKPYIAGLISVFLLGLLIQSTALNASGTPELSGLWNGTVNGQPVLLEFKTKDLLIYDGDAVQYQLAPGVIRIYSDEGLFEVPYRLDKTTLWLTMAEGQVAFHRGGGDIQARQQHIDQLILQLLTYYSWQSWSYKGTSSTDYGSGGDSLEHSHSSERRGKLTFFPNGTYLWGEQGESHYTGSFTHGTGVDLASTANSTGGDGRYRVSNGALFATEGNGPMKQVDFLVKCNYESRHSDEPFQLTPDGRLHFTNEGIRCYCGGAPLIYVEGTEYMIGQIRR